MPWTPKTFKARLPAFKCVSNPAVQYGIDEAERCTNRCNWGVKADDAVLYQAAHIIALNTQMGKAGAGGIGVPTGPIKSERLLEWAATYDSVSAFSGAMMATTVYGRHFVAMKRMIFSNRCI